MTQDPLVAEVPGNRQEVLQKLVQHAVSGMPVVKARTDELAGVITRSDIFRSPQEEQVALIMTSDPYTITRDADVSEAAELFFEHQIHGLPVVGDDGETLEGVLSPTDILEVLHDEEDAMVEDFITRKTSPIHEETPLTVAWETMNLTDWNALPVLDDNAELSGVVVDSDLFQHNEVQEDVTRDDLDLGEDAASQASERIGLIMPLYYANSRVDLPATPVSDIMVDEVVTVFRKTGVGAAAEKMSKHEINQLPVLDNDDRLMGMITDLDLMQVVA